MRIASELPVFFCDVDSRPPNLHVRAVRLIDPRERILILAVMVVVVVVVATPHALVVVLTVSHGFPVHQLPIYGGFFSANLLQIVSDHYESAHYDAETTFLFVRALRKGHNDRRHDDATTRFVTRLDLLTLVTVLATTSPQQRSSLAARTNYRAVKSNAHTTDSI